MLTRFFDVLNSDVQVKLLLGANPLRVYPYGTKLDTIPKRPYVLYGIFNATPYNQLDCPPDMDLSGVQADIYGESSASVISCFNAVRNAVEFEGYVTNFSTPSRDIETGLYHIMIEVDFHDER